METNKKSKDITSNGNMDEHNIKLHIMKKLGVQKELTLEEKETSKNTMAIKENNVNEKKKENRKKSKKLNKKLHKAKEEKKDEFYTQLTDIEKELKHYKKHFKNKIVYCNCDDPTVSNFFYYFCLNFKTLGLKKLITTCYKNKERDKFSKNQADDAIYLEYSGTKNSTGVPDYDRDIIVKKLKGDKNFKGGDFRSKECIKLLNQADIITTNPPFSLFREYIAQLIECDKKFIIIGNTNALTYKEVFKLFKENKIRTGCTKFNVGMFFLVPDDWENFHHIDEKGNKIARVSTSCWFTNLDIKKRHEHLILYKKYSPKDYPKYDNYDAIEVSKYTDIPIDYDGAMGVPITFLDKYNPEQFEIIKFRKGDDDKDLKMGKKYPYFRVLIRKRRYKI
jgi:hypothetical protein